VSGRSPNWDASLFSQGLPGWVKPPRSSNSLSRAESPPGAPCASFRPTPSASEPPSNCGATRPFSAFLFRPSRVWGHWHSPALLNDLGGDLAALLSSRRDIDTHLVLTATARQTDLEGAVGRFQMFRPSRLIFTRLDETDSLGAAFSVAARHGKPVSFFCNGQLIPEDIQPASRSVLVEALVRRLPEVLRAAA